MLLAEELAKNHSQFGIYSSTIRGQNILDDLRDLQTPELDYLLDFYASYFNAYKPPSMNSGNLSNAVLAKNTDLFFIGQEALSSSAKFMFVFEGSLQDPKKLSITVLACFWLLNDSSLSQQHKNVLKQYWSLCRYKDVKDKLGINADIAKNSYVVDMVRVGNRQDKPDLGRSREVLKMDFYSIRPKHVISVGIRTRDFIKDAIPDECIRTVYFPSYTNRSRERAKEEWCELGIFLRQVVEGNIP